MALDNKPEPALTLYLGTLEEPTPWPMMRRTAPIAGRSCRPGPGHGFGRQPGGRRTRARPEDGRREALTIPRRPLGKTGIDVTILDAGTGKGAGLQRILRFAYAQGIRCFDTSERYQSEPDFKLVPAGARGPQADLRGHQGPAADAGGDHGQARPALANMGTDYVDLFFIHSFGDNHSLDEAISFVKSREFKETADAIRKSGKARLVGISTHHKDRAQIIQAAAEGGIVDAIMLQYTPWLDKDAPLNRALDACWKKGIGLISMKQIAGHFLSGERKGNILDEVARRVPCWPSAS